MSLAIFSSMKDVTGFKMASINLSKKRQIYGEIEMSVECASLQHVFGVNFYNFQFNMFHNQKTNLKYRNLA
jgi:hypothetical protein